MKAVRNVLYNFDSFTVDVAEGRLWRDNQLIGLTPKAFDTLLVLLAHRGNVVNKDTLLDEVWKNTFVEESTLAQNISTLRKALGTLPGGGQFIETVPRRGYRFTADVKEIIGEDEIIVVRRRVRTQISAEREDTSMVVRQAGRSFEWASRNRVLAAVSTLGVVTLLAAGGLTIRTIMRPAPLSASAFTQTTVTKLTSHGDIDLVRISPDGNFIALVEKRGSNSSVSLRQIDNSTTIEIVPSAARQIIGLTFAPDGKQIYFTGYDQSVTGSVPVIGQLYKVSTLGGPVQAIAEDVDSAITISPDSRQYAFVRNYLADKQASIVVHTFENGEERILATRELAKPYSPSGLAWSPDGKIIAAIARGDDSLFQVVSVDTAVGSESPVSSQRWQWIGSPNWLRDGSGLVVSAFSSGSQDQTDEIWAVPFPEGKARRVADGTSGIYGLSLSANSESLVAVKSQMVSTFFVAGAANPADAVKIRGNLPDYDTSVPGVVWTADRRILFGTTLNGNSDIWIMNADGSNAQQLTTDPAIDSQPVISSDRQLIFFVSNRSGTRELYRIRLDGSEQKPLTSGEIASSPSLSVDGKQIYYAALDKQTQRTMLRRIPIEGGESSQVTSIQTVLPQVSPDGKQIACWYPAPGASGQGARDLVLTILSAETGGVLKQFDANFRDSSLPLIWPDNETVAYSTYDGPGSKLWKQPVNGGPTQLVLNSPNERIVRFAWSPDNQEIFYEKGTAINDVILLKSRVG